MFANAVLSNREKMNRCSFQEVLRQNLSWFLSQHRKTLFLRGFILKPTERAYIFLKMEIFKIVIRLRCFYMTVTGKFEYFQYFNFDTNFLKNENLSAFSEH